MKFETDITTKNWSNSWNDIDERLPDDGTDCYILWDAEVIDYNYETMKSEAIRKYRGMGSATFKNSKWEEIATESPCEDCWNQGMNNLYDDYFNPSTEYATYQIIDEDVFESDSKQSRIFYKEIYWLGRGYKKTKRCTSCVFNILAWCSIPDEPVNPFEVNNEI